MPSIGAYKKIESVACKLFITELDKILCAYVSKTGNSKSIKKKKKKPFAFFPTHWYDNNR